MCSSVWGCSDTTCRDRLVPGGGVAVNEQCGVLGDGVADAGVDENNNPDDPDAGNPDPVNNNPSNNNPVNNNTNSNNNPDPVNNNPDPNNNPTPATLEGDWVSAGDDIAPLLKQGGFEIDALDVVFTETEYTGVIALASGDEVPYGGTYTVNRGTTPWTIVLRQTAPQTLTSQGIVEVTGTGASAVMRLEIVQVDPPTLGAQPPTPAGGFGSTQGVDNPEDNIQVYRRP